MGDQLPYRGANSGTNTMAAGPRAFPTISGMPTASNDGRTKQQSLSATYGQDFVARQTQPQTTLFATWQRCRVFSLELHRFELHLSRCIFTHLLLTAVANNSLQSSAESVGPVNLCARFYAKTGIQIRIVLATRMCYTRGPVPKTLGEMAELRDGRMVFIL
jgi:hypothetical protein